ncbi:MAG: DNA-binding response regulator [Planctomycetes bacterium]|nr:DNA-binding response regulator [Planctomycetota bacterium]
MRVLVVEDEPHLARAVREALEVAGFAVDEALDGETGLHMAVGVDYDAIVLDLMLPDVSGWTILDRLRKVKPTPVLVLTALDAVDEKVRCLDAGADDYLTKPFEIEELKARVRALVRRGAGQAAPVIDLGGIVIDTAGRTVKANGHEVNLAPKEYALLELLALRRGTLVTRTMIYEHLWDEHDGTWSNVVDVYVSNLRSKLGPDVVTTRRGQGYIIA